ncbi:MAG: alcohol dehydrogenase family protein [Pseudomonadota bacterium]
MPDMMRAMVLTGHGEMDRLVWTEDMPMPVPGLGQIRMRVLACGLNNTDVNTRTGWYSKGVTGATTGGALTDAASNDAAWGGAPLTFPRIQGADVCGRVDAVGQDVDPSLVGKRVLVDPWHYNPVAPEDPTQARYFGSEMDGGFAEYTVSQTANVHPIECDLDDAELATFATSWVTAENMLNRAAVKAGDRVLITGASGGVGSALIQLAARRGAEPIAMAATAKADAVRQAGAAHVIDSRTATLAQDLQEQTGTAKVSVVADIVGGALFTDLISVLVRGGRYTCAGAIAGPLVEMDLRTFYLNDLTFTGATVVPPGTFADLVAYIARGEVKPMLAATYPLRELHAAQTAFIEKNHVGNIVVIP